MSGKSIAVLAVLLLILSSCSGGGDGEASDHPASEKNGSVPALKEDVVSGGEGSGAAEESGLSSDETAGITETPAVPGTDASPAETGTVTDDQTGKEKIAAKETEDTPAYTKDPFELPVDYS